MWHRFKSQLHLVGQDDSPAVEAMRQKPALQVPDEQNQIEQSLGLLIGGLTVALISLLLAFVKSCELLRQLSLARAAQQESEQRFAKLAEASFEGLLIAQNGLVVLANDQICVMTGFSQHEIIGKRSEDLVVVAEQDRIRHKIESHDEAPYESWGLRKDGSTFPVEIEGKSVQFKGVPTRVTAVRDLSARKRIEAQLREANQRLEQMASQDELTGLFNRRAFNTQFQLELDRALRYNTPLSLLLLDIDRFKNVNDQWGHDYGDEVLREVSHILKDTVRPSDFVARYGGEELIIILPNTDKEGSVSSAERCRHALEQAPWPRQHITASVGAATLTPTLNTAHLLVKAVDCALYQSKATGRNCTTHFADMKNVDLSAFQNAGGLNRETSP